MADFYALEYVGGPDGTQNPPKKLDGRLVGAKERRNRAVKPSVTLAAGDRIYIGKVPAGSNPNSFSALTDTTLGTTTISIGTTSNPTKYVSAKTLTTVDVPTALGPKGSVVSAAPLTADEDLWATLGVGGIASGINLTFFTGYTIST